MKISVGNLSPDVTEDELREEFKVFGIVTSVNIVRHKHSGQSKGLAFVEIASRDEGLAAIDGLKGKKLKDRTLDVNEAGSRSGGRSGGFSGKGKRRKY